MYREKKEQEQKENVFTVILGDLYSNVNQRLILILICTILIVCLICYIINNSFNQKCSLELSPNNNIDTYRSYSEVEALGKWGVPNSVQMLIQKIELQELFLKNNIKGPKPMILGIRYENDSEIEELGKRKQEELKLSIEDLYRITSNYPINNNPHVVDNPDDIKEIKDKIKIFNSIVPKQDFYKDTSYIRYLSYLEKNYNYYINDHDPCNINKLCFNTLNNKLELVLNFTCVDENIKVPTSGTIGLIFWDYGIVVINYEKLLQQSDDDNKNNQNKNIIDISNVCINKNNKLEFEIKTKLLDGEIFINSNNEIKLFITDGSTGFLLTLIL
ncbi:MAG: hypothetical protein ACFFDN_27840 [Candidatus Hodarchaeota archaeon]